MWQAFPANGGRDRTTYMFAYADNARQRPSLEVSHRLHFQQVLFFCGCDVARICCCMTTKSPVERHMDWHSVNAGILQEYNRLLLQAMLDRYFELLPHVCGMPLAYLNFRRMLFAGLPSYASSPLRPKFDRILQASLSPCALSPCSTLNLWPSSAPSRILGSN